MIPSRCFTTVSLLWGLFCFQNTVGRSLAPLYDSPNSALIGFGPDGLTAGIGGSFGADLSAEVFSNVLFGQLINNGAFLNLFSSPVNVDIAANIGISMAQALVAELGLADTYLAINLLTNALTGLNPSAGPESFGKALSNAIGLILFNNGLLYSSDTHFLADRISKAIIKASLKFSRGEGGLGLSLGTGLGVGAGIDTGLNFGAINNLNTNLGANVGGFYNDFNADVNLDTATQLELGTKDSSNANLGIGLDANANLRVGLDLGADIKAAVNTGFDVDLKVSADAVLQFKSELTKGLLKDKYFKYLFSDYIPPSALNTVAAAIAQYLSKAFGLPRSTLLSLEKNMSTLTINKTLTLEAYADLIASSLANILADANIIVNSAAMLQITIALKAISSGISNFLGISSVPGVGLSISSNSYNSFFSVLSGLEKLPYVGTDSVSRKFPPILKTAKASSFALQFTKVLFYNLVSSSTFYETFSLGVPVSTYKIIANTLGNYMAEAFGSPSPSIFSDIYTSALLTTLDKLNYKTYAGMLSVATARALYSLGYFLSGNVNIQAAIATNAVIRALVTKLRQRSSVQTVLYPTVLNLPLMTPLTGVAPPESILKVTSGLGASLGLRAELKLGAGLSLGGGLGSEAGVGIDANLDVGLGAGAGAGVGASFDAATNFDAKVKANLDTDFEPVLGMSLKDYLYNDPGIQAAAQVGLAVDSFKSIRRKRDLTNVPNPTNSNQNSDVFLKAGATAGFVDKTGNGVGAGVGVEAPVSADLGVKSGSGAIIGTKAQLSVLDVLPQMLANKLYISTALYTAFAAVDKGKVVNLIAQAMASEFGFPVAAVFLKSYENSFTNSTDNSYGISIVALASATTAGLTATGILDSSFTVQTADQLSTALVAKYSSLIATSLEVREWNLIPKWTNRYDGNQWDPLFGAYAALK